MRFGILILSKKLFNILVYGVDLYKDWLIFSILIFIEIECFDCVYRWGRVLVIVIEWRGERTLIIVIIIDILLFEYLFVGENLNICILIYFLLWICFWFEVKFS